MALVVSNILNARILHQCFAKPEEMDQTKLAEMSKFSLGLALGSAVLVAFNFILTIITIIRSLMYIL